MSAGTIVVGTDFSPASEVAAAWACHFLGPEGQAVVIHVLPEPAAPEAARADSALERLVAGLPCRARGEVAHGRAARALAGAADRLDADLIAIGPRGKRASRLGTTAEQLVRASARPVLVVRDPPGRAPRRVLVAVDASERADLVLEWGARICRQFTVPATIVHALSPDLLAALRAARPESAERAAADAARGEAERWLRERTADAGYDLSLTTLATPFGSPAHEIIRRTEREEHELVVMGSRGAGAIGREIFGSVASHVLRGAWCSVLVV